MAQPEAGVRPMYVQIAAGSIFDGASLTLLDLAPATIFTVDEPAASVGHLPTGVFLDHWYGDDSGPSARSVPATLALLDADRRADSSAHLMISLPRIRGTGLEYRAHAVDGEPPPTSGACVLFIQPLVPPVTPFDAGGSPLGDQPTSLPA